MAEKSMIERVARALAEADNGAPTTWRMYYEDAKVAIGAMRRPSAAMLEAGHCARDSWMRMIDTALADDQSASPNT